MASLIVPPSAIDTCDMSDRRCDAQATLQRRAAYLAGLLLEAEGSLLSHEGSQLALPLFNLPLPHCLLSA